jgi:hypothetical protein
VIKVVFCTLEVTRLQQMLFFFQGVTFKKCLEAELVHKARSNWATSIYKNVVLPSTPNTISGYHSKCYAKYTAVSSAAKKTVVQKRERENTPLAEPSAGITILTYYSS